MAESNIKSGRAVVVTPGTAVPLSTFSGEGDTTHCVRILVNALPGNTGAVYVGGSDVSAVSGSEKGLALAKLATEPNFVIELKMDDISKVFIDAVNASDGVAFLYEY